jgi:excisionase family DNA binding protein
MTKNHHRLTVTVEEAGALLGVGRSTAYELVRSGDIPCIRLRRRIVVPIGRLAERLRVSTADILGAIDVAEDQAGLVEQRQERPTPTLF